MNYMFLDIETTGLPKDFNGMIADGSNWPRLVQLGFSICNEKGKETHDFQVVLKPDGWKMGATHVHGITQEQAEREGKPLESVLKQFTSWAHVCEAIVCHNVDFDLPILQAEFYRAGLPHPWHGKRIYCTQKQTTEIVKIPKEQKGFEFAGYEWPSLKELAGFCDVPYGQYAHTALADARVTALCYFFLKDKYPEAFFSPYYYSRLLETVGHPAVKRKGCTSYII